MVILYIYQIFSRSTMSRILSHLDFTAIKKGRDFRQRN